MSSNSMGWFCLGNAHEGAMCPPPEAQTWPLLPNSGKKVGSFYLEEVLTTILGTLGVT